MFDILYTYGIFYGVTKFDGKIIPTHTKYSIKIQIINSVHYFQLRITRNSKNIISVISVKFDIKHDPDSTKKNRI